MLGVRLARKAFHMHETYSSSPSEVLKCLMDFEFKARSERKRRPSSEMDGSEYREVRPKFSWFQSLQHELSIWVATTVTASVSKNYRSVEWLLQVILLTYIILQYQYKKYICTSYLEFPFREKCLGNPGNPRLWREIGSRAPYIDSKINYTSQDVHNIPNWMGKEWLAYRGG